MTGSWAIGRVGKGGRVSAMVLAAWAACAGCRALPEALSDVVNSGPVLDGVTEVHAVYASCGLRDGTLQCWGADPFNRVGPTDTLERSWLARPVAADRSFSEVVMGAGFSCGLVDGEAYCWGNNDHGQLGDGTTQRSSEPHKVSGATRFRKLVAGELHACGLTDDGRAFCWGAEQHFAALAPSDTPPLRGAGPCPYGCLLTTTELVPNTLTDLFAGGYSTCGMRADQLFCWGNVSDNRFRAPDDGGLHDSTDPDFGHVPGSFLTVSLHIYNACAITTGGDLFCSGLHGNGQLGVGDAAPARCAGDVPCAEQPVRVGTRSDWSAVAVGASHVCGIAAGQALCWGSDASGQLGLAQPPSIDCKFGYRDVHCANTPSAVEGTGTWTSIASGHEHSCGTRADGVYCWGNVTYSNDPDETASTPRLIHRARD